MKWTKEGAAIAAAVLAGGAAAIALARSAAVRYPVGDIALLEIYTREALAGRLLEGPYSHFPWHHPGPVYFYAVAPIYVLGRHTSASLNAGAAIVALVSIGTICWILSRATSRWIAALVAGCVIVYALRIDGLLVSAWNPHVVVLPVAAALLAASALAAGDGAMLPILVVGLSFAVQTDLAVAPAVAACSGAAVIACVRRGAVSRRQLTVAGTLAALLWLAPVVEQATATPGNVSAIVRFFVGGHAGGQTMAAAAAAWSGMIAAPFRAGVTLPTGGALGATPTTEIAAAIGLTLAAIAAATIAFRANDAWPGWFAATVALAAVVSFWSVTRIDGPITDHQVFWIGIVGVLELAAVLTVAVNLLLRARQWNGPIWIASLIQVALLAAMVVVSVSQMRRARDGSAPVTVFLPSIANFGESIRRHLEATGAHRALVRIDQAQWGVAAGILLQLQRLGIPFSVEESWASMFPRELRETGREDIELTIAATGGNPELSGRPGDALIDISTHVEVHALMRKH